MHHLLMEFPGRSDYDTPTKRDYFKIMSFVEMLLQQVHELIIYGKTKTPFSMLPDVRNSYRKNLFRYSRMYETYTVKAFFGYPLQKNLYGKRYLFGTPLSSNLSFSEGVN